MTIYLVNGEKIENVKFIQERRDGRGLVYFYINAGVDGGLFKVYNLYVHEIHEIKIELS